MSRCAGCGYSRAMHDLLGKCPLCACGELPAAHDLLADGGKGCPCGCGRPAVEHLSPKNSCGCPLTATEHTCRWARWWGAPCPGRRSKTSGEWLLLRQATFREPEPAIERRDWFGLFVPVPATATKDLDEPTDGRPPRVPARPPAGPTEMAGAGGGKQGSKLGRGAIALGWHVEARYWQAADGAEGCAVLLSKAELRAVALWSRKAADAGKLTGWKAEGAYAWRNDSGRFPTKLSHTELEKVIS